MEKMNVDSLWFCWLFVHQMLDSDVRKSEIRDAKSFWVPLLQGIPVNAAAAGWKFASSIVSKTNMTAVLRPAAAVL